MAGSHLVDSCQCMPGHLKQHLKMLRGRKDTASGGKQYWADGARAIGLYETDDGLKLKREEAPAPAKEEKPDESATPAEPENETKAKEESGTKEEGESEI